MLFYCGGELAVGVACGCLLCLFDLAVVCLVCDCGVAWPLICLFALRFGFSLRGV